MSSKSRVLILVVAYNAEKTIEQVLTRIPVKLLDQFEVEILIIDDASQDATFEVSHDVRSDAVLPFDLHILFNPVNQGYGGNQKIGYEFAIQKNFDFVALVHGDAQYAPECLPELLQPLLEGAADAVFGSRMLDRTSALKGGMPVYKYVGNKILTRIENMLLGTKLSEFHSGYRIYSVEALKRLPFRLNTNDFHFDTEIIIQIVLAGLTIKELPIPTYYGDEICHVNGMKYAANVVRAVLKARVQAMGIFYDRRFDCRPNADNSHYTSKLEVQSTHSEALQRIPLRSRVLDLGCAGGYVGSLLSDKSNCVVTGCDVFPLDPVVTLANFILHDLNNGPPAIQFANFDYILMLDVIEHLSYPERFVDQLAEAMRNAPEAKLIVTTGNVAFIIIRLMLFFGQFNYGKRGILDMTHTRLFTFSSFRRLFEQAGFDILEIKGIPVPLSVVMGGGIIRKSLMWVSQKLISAARNAFSYQILMVVRAKPSVDTLLLHAFNKSATRAAVWEMNRGKISSESVQDAIS